MKIKYLGPRASVEVAPHGTHKRDEVKTYPDKFGKELLETSKRQKFKKVNNTLTAAEKAKRKAEVEAKKKAAKEKAEVEAREKAEVEAKNKGPADTE